jgi:adenine-specific DNA-methyltransferase
MLRIWDIMGFMRENYGKDYAANSRETIRRQTIHQFEQARIVDRNPDDPSRPTNSGMNCYALTDAAVSVLKTYGTKAFDSAVERFVRRFGQLQKAYGRRRDLQQVKLRLPDGARLRLSPGKHNTSPRKPRKVPRFPGCSCIFGLLATETKTRGKPLKTGDRGCH